MKIRQHIVSLLPVGGLGLLLLLPPGGRAADDEGRPQPKASFGDVIERQLPAPSYVVEQQVLLNLDNGELLPMPTNVWKMSFGFSPRPRYDWMVKHGADLLVHCDAHSYPSTNLCFQLDDGWLALLGRDLTFETIAASDVNPLLAGAGVFQHLEVPKPEQGAWRHSGLQDPRGGGGCHAAPRVHCPAGTDPETSLQAGATWTLQAEISWGLKPALVYWRKAKTKRHGSQSRTGRVSQRRSSVRLAVGRPRPSVAALYVKRHHTADNYGRTKGQDDVAPVSEVRKHENLEALQHAATHFWLHIRVVSTLSKTSVVSD